MEHHMKNAALSVLLIAFSSSIIFASPGGKSGTTGKTGGSGCATCHGSAATPGVIGILAGPGTLVPGQKAAYTLTITGGPGAGSGCNIAASSGTLAPVSSYIKLLGDELVQTASTAFLNGSITYSFTYTAPMTAGSVTLYGTAYSSNRSQSSGVWNLTPNKSIAVVVPTAAPAVPAPSAPANNALNQSRSLQLVWNSVNLAETYRVQCSTDAGFTAIVADTTVSDTLLAISNFQNAVKYYWRVNSKNIIGSSAWSASYNFTTLAGLPLTGIKTVGGASPNYPSLKSALRDLSLLGTAAPGVIFAIRPGTYVEDSLIVQTATASASAPVTIMPESGASVTINDSASSTQTFVIKIDNTPYVTIDGGASRSLTINGVGANAMRGVYVAGNSPFATIKNCVIRAGGYSSSSYLAVELSSPTPKLAPHNSRVQNNIIRNSYYGIRLTGNAATDTLLNVVVSNNLIDSVAISGIYVTYCAYAQIANNDVSLLIGGTSSMYGIYVGSSCDYTRVYSNKIHDINQLSATSTTAGIYCSVGSSSHGGTSVFNNFVSMNQSTAGTGIIYGISMYETSNLYPDTVVYNSVNIYGTSAGIRQSVAIYRASSTGTAGVLFRNNIAQNIRTDAGGAYTAIGKTAAATAMSSDYNAFYVSTTDSSHAIGRINATTPVLYRTLADWRLMSGGDSSSITVQPAFVSMSDLHIPNGTATQIEGHGTPIPGITTDIDGNPRDAKRPDIGADEFNGTTAVVSLAEIPASFTLAQNFPNPFNPATTIRYALPSQCAVTLVIYNALGQIVSVVVNEVQTAGNKEATWTAKNFPSGMYFYRLQAGDHISVKKMALVK